MLPVGRLDAPQHGAVGNRRLQRPGAGLDDVVAPERTLGPGSGPAADVGACLATDEANLDRYSNSFAKAVMLAAIS